MSTPVDILITRVVDRTARSDDWIELEELAQREAGTWERLHLAMQDDLLLRSAVEPELALADAIELPHIPLRVPIGRVLAPAGWLAALVVALLWIGHSALLPAAMLPGALPEVDPAEGTILRGTSISTRQKEFGEVLEELPTDVLELNPHGDGRVEVVYRRQTIERAIVDGAYGLVEDELGNSRPMRLDDSKLAKPRVF